MSTYCMSRHKLYSTYADCVEFNAELADLTEV